MRLHVRTYVLKLLFETKELMKVSKMVIMSIYFHNLLIILEDSVTSACPNLLNAHLETFTKLEITPVGVSYTN